MLIQTRFISRQEAEKLTGNESMAMISITQPGCEEATLLNGWKSVLRVAFDDNDPKIVRHKQRKTPRIAMTEQQALAIVQFVHENAPVVTGLIVHCQGGISRSAAVAKWISEAYKLPFDIKYELYNRHVFQLLLTADRQYRK